MKTTGRHLRVDELSREEIRLICDAPNPRCATGSRNRALLALLYRAGLRVGEALELAPESIDFERGLIHVEKSKTKTGIRSAAIDKAGLERLQHWLDWRLRRAISSPLLFCTLDGCPLLSCYVRAMIPRMARRAGIAKRVHAHALRHSHAVELIEEGANVAEIRDQLGHSSIAVTDAYLNKSRMNRSRIARIHSREWKEIACPSA